MKVHINTKIQLNPSELNKLIGDYLRQSGYEVKDEEVEWLVNTDENGKARFAGCLIDAGSKSQDIKSA